MNIEITKMTSKGQVVIPQEMRKEKGLKEGERFLVYDVDDNIILKRIRNLQQTRDAKEFENVFAKTWKIAKVKGLTKKDIKEEIELYRKEKKRR